MQILPKRKLENKKGKRKEKYKVLFTKICVSNVSYVFS